MSDFSLNNPPLICVAARVQFAPVDKIEDYIPRLQESLRLDGYPLAQDPLKTKAWRIDDRADSGMNVEFQVFARWDFSNMERTVTIRVDRESLTLLFTDYDHFKNAEPHYRNILAKVEQSIPALLPQLVQLRYMAYISLADGSGPAEWVVRSVLGMPNLEGLSRQGSISETNFLSVEDGQLVVRCTSLGPKGLTLPPDLLPLNAKLKYDLQSKSEFILLENLHQRKADETVFTAESCLAQLSALRRYNSEVFRATVTQKAIDSWK